MAHRALVAYASTPDRYDVHTARLGGYRDLSRTITPAAPFADGAVDPEPRVRRRPFSSVLTMVDPGRHEVLYRVERDRTVRTYCVLWLGMAHYLGEAADTDTGGLLVAVDSLAAAETLQRWLRAAKGLLADAVDAGHLDPAAAGDALRAAARRRAGDREIFALNE